MNEPLVKNRIMRYIRTELRGGPAFGIVLLEQAREFGCAASTLDTRLRQLRADGFLSRERLLLAGASKKRYVAYRCSAEQYHAWVTGRGTATASHHGGTEDTEDDGGRGDDERARGSELRGGGAHPPGSTPRAGAPGLLFDNSLKIHGVSVGGRRA